MTFFWGVLFFDTKGQQRPYIIFTPAGDRGYSEPGCGARELISFFDDGPKELYDPGGQTDLPAQYPGRVARPDSALCSWQRTSCIPLNF
ncbi:hypothetical protein [Niabella drilacis]|uniref:Uncharacterized protein n=1 Tax=Niabella drilacis (strain DSM 25811 / CCM 8410 / CCUG 62505 / LMG 26954 / E90) TaxID=1285928 RepID=A0A1G6ZQH4_NIADE|nr:hypothetical protein [Niabella drilacis]SDE04928.1 hypothetical protein SAMN04487894_11926 [Niabella drilacis]